MVQESVAQAFHFAAYLSVFMVSAMMSHHSDDAAHTFQFTHRIQIEHQMSIGRGGRPLTQVL